MGELQAIGDRNQIGAERGRLGHLVVVAFLASAHLRMQDAQLGRHLPGQVFQFVAIRHPCQQRQVARTHGIPVDTAHVRIEREFPVHAPGVVEHLLPFRAWIDGQAPVADAQFVPFHLLRRLVAGIDHEHRACAMLAPFHQQQLAGVG